jgi:hypothetical protein
MKKIAVLIFCGFLLPAISFSQVRKIPAEVTSAFEKKYPNAKDVEYKDMLKSVNVEFLQDSSKMIAKFNNRGDWKETEKQSDYYSLPSDIKEGYMKSKYADGEWEVKEASVIYLPGDVTQYRIKVEKGDLQKKNLYFDQYGRLLRDPITI